MDATTVSVLGGVVSAVGALIGWRKLHLDKRKLELDEIADAYKHADRVREEAERQRQEEKERAAEEEKRVAAILQRSGLFAPTPIQTRTVAETKRKKFRDLPHLECLTIPLFLLQRIAMKIRENWKRFDPQLFRTNTTLAPAGVIHGGLIFLTLLSGHFAYDAVSPRFSDWWEHVVLAHDTIDGIAPIIPARNYPIEAPSEKLRWEQRQRLPQPSLERPERNPHKTGDDEGTSIAANATEKEQQVFEKVLVLAAVSRPLIGKAQGPTNHRPRQILKVLHDRQTVNPEKGERTQREILEQLKALEKSFTEGSPNRLAIVEIPNRLSPLDGQVSRARPNLCAPPQGAPKTIKCPEPISPEPASTSGTRATASGINVKKTNQLRPSLKPMPLPRIGAGSFVS